jgi:hypothetical protein
VQWLGVLIPRSLLRGIQVLREVKGQVHLPLHARILTVCGPLTVSCRMLPSVLNPDRSPHLVAQKQPILVQHVIMQQFFSNRDRCIRSKYIEPK